MTSSPQLAPGWYADPETPGSERRWDGTAWIGTPHRTPARSSMFGPAYDRAYWTNANPAARVARWAGVVGLLPILALIPILLGVSTSTTVTILFGSTLVAIAAEVVAVVAGIVGISRGRRAGALALSIQVTVAALVLFLTYSLATLVITSLSHF